MLVTQELCQLILGETYLKTAARFVWYRTYNDVFVVMVFKNKVVYHLV